VILGSSATFHKIRLFQAVLLTRQEMSVDVHMAVQHAEVKHSVAFCLPHRHDQGSAWAREAINMRVVSKPRKRGKRRLS
tara:strand:+ start:1270 stop:1506 length:237 start_codon:yes stop_codon:yes gene_type:complete